MCLKLPAFCLLCLNVIALGFPVHAQPVKGDVQLLMTPPLCNMYNLSLGERIQAATPLSGAAIGMGYWYGNRNMVSVEVGGVLAHTPYCPDGCRFSDSIPSQTTGQSTLYLGLKHHHFVGRFDLAYGVYYGNRKWEIDNTTSLKSIPVDGESSTDIGPVVSFRYSIFRFLHFGLEYQPHFFAVKHGATQSYQHLLIIGFQFRIMPKITGGS